MFSSYDPLEEHYRSERPEEDDYFRKLDQELMVALREKKTLKRWSRPFGLIPVCAARRVARR